MSTLQVAACPRCKQALVFGEKACVHCGQTFQYGASSPPEPSAAQIKAALAVAGAAPRPERQSHQPHQPGLADAQAALDAAVRARTQAQAQRQAEGPSLAGIDTGRFGDVGDVEVQEIPGFVDSTLFKAFTPAHVAAQQVFGFDAGRFAELGNVAALPAPAGLEQTAADDVDVGFVNVVSGIFGSAIYDTRNVEVAPPAVDGLEASPSVQRAKIKRVPDDELPKIVCRCGETHRFPRCPSCGTVHPACEG